MMIHDDENDHEHHACENDHVNHCAAGGHWRWTSDEHGRGHERNRKHCRTWQS